MEQTMESQTWGRFELVAHLGKGGMGDVYKAYDPTLKRFVAIKILRYEDPEVVKRFLREACSQARVEHRYICKIYESGEYDGHPYIAMQFIEGEDLKALNKQLNFEEKIRIIKNVALGLHAAHTQGLIHRDVKPANIMLNHNEEGQWKPYIMDFGIAREQAAPGLTSTGMVVGTPFYMSPEQAKGKMMNQDRRSDIYSLGVTMYELFTGDVPFHGDTPVEVLMSVLEQEPVPIRKINPKLPVDIETIVMKCLEKEPGRRYQSAKDLADDLQRYLEGDPISARPTTITYRLKRKLKKHKWPVVSVGIASLLIILLMGLWIQSQRTASQRALIAQELGQEVEKIDSTIHYAHLLPLHDISREKEIIRNRIRLIESKMKNLGKMALGPGHYAMGRGYMALQDFGKARDHLEASWKAGYNQPEVAYEMGRVLGELYLKESEKANRIESKELRESRKKEIEKNLREPAVSFLRKGLNPGESKEYIDALIAFYELKYNESLKILQRILETGNEESPWFYDSKILEGNIYSAMGKDKINYDEGVAFFTKAENIYLEVIKIGQSDISGYIGLLRVLERQMMIDVHSAGKDVPALGEKAIALCQKALQIDPGMADIFVMQSSVYRWMGRYEMITGKDPVPNLDQSIASAQSAIDLQPDNYEAYGAVGSTEHYKAEYMMAHGQDPTEIFEKAATSFKKAVQINPTYVMALNGIGNVYVRMAEYQKGKGIDPSSSLTQAVSTYEKALNLNPNLVNLYNGLAAASWIHAGWMAERGQDPRPMLGKAVKSLESAIKLNPGFVHFYTNLGFVYMDLARYESDHGLDPVDTVNKTLTYFEKAIKINRKGNELYTGLLSVAGIQTRYEYLMGRDVTGMVSKARDYYKRGLESNPNDSLLYYNMASILFFQARARVFHGQMASHIMDEAEQLLEKSLELNSKSADTFTRKGDLMILKGEIRVAEGKSPDSYFGIASTAIKQAMGLNPSDIQPYLANARLNWVKSRWGLSRNIGNIGNSGIGGNAGKFIGDGLTSIEKVLSINAGYGECYLLKSLLLKLRATLPENRSTSGHDEKEAKALFSKGIEINSNLKNTYNKDFHQ